MFRFVKAVLLALFLFPTLAPLFRVEGKDAMDFLFVPEAFQDVTARRFAVAVAAGEVEVALEAAHAAPGGINTLGAQGETGLVLAVERLNGPMVLALLHAGANPDGGPDRAPVALAVRARDLAIARMLLEAGANPNGRLGGEPGLYKAVMVGSQAAIDLLLEFNARVDEPNRVGSPPSFAAAASGQWTLVKYLLDHGGQVWVANQAGFTLGGFAKNSRLLPGSPNHFALTQVIALWQSKGLPWPPPKTPMVAASARAGQWPPTETRR